MNMENSKKDPLTAEELDNRAMGKTEESLCEKDCFTDEPSGGISRRNFMQTGATVAGATALAFGLNLYPDESVAQTHEPKAYVYAPGKGVFDHVPFGEQGLKEVYDWLDKYVSTNKNIATKKIIAKSYPGNIDVPAVFVTNSSIPDDKKQIAIVTLVRHGQEAGARVVGAEILQYLATDDAKDIHDNQVVIIVPVVNPEGFIAEQVQLVIDRTHKKRTPRFGAAIPGEHTGHDS